MASGTVHLLEQPLAVDPVHRDLFAVLIAQRTDIDMTLDTAGLHLRAAQKRMLPVLDVPVRHRNRIDRGRLPFMAGSAAELIGRMFADDLLEVGMGAERLRRIFEAAFVDAHVAGLAAVDARYRFV